MEKTQKNIEVIFKEGKLYCQYFNWETRKNTEVKMQIFRKNNFLEIYQIKVGPESILAFVDVSGAEPLYLDNLTRISVELVGVDLFEGVFTLRTQFKSKKNYEVFVRDEEGVYQNLTAELATIPRANASGVITEFVFGHGVYDVHLSAKGYDQTFYYIHENGKWRKVFSFDARKIREQRLKPRVVSHHFG